MITLLLVIVIPLWAGFPYIECTFLVGIVWISVPMKFRFDKVWKHLHYWKQRKGRIACCFIYARRSDRRLNRCTSSHRTRAGTERKVTACSETRGKSSEGDALFVYRYFTGTRFDFRYFLDSGASPETKWRRPFFFSLPLLVHFIFKQYFRLFVDSQCRNWRHRRWPTSLAACSGESTETIRRWFER